MKPNKSILKILLLLVVACSSKTVMAQEEEKYEYLDTLVNTNYHETNVKLLHLDRSYQLGDGATLIAGGHFLNVSQTLQTTYISTFNRGGEKDPTGEMSFRRARLTIVSNLIDQKLHFVSRINFVSNNQSATTGDRSFNANLQEAYLEYRLNKQSVINFGLRADYIDSRETRFQGENLGFMDRSELSGAFDAIFDYGIRYKGNFRFAGNQVIRPYLSITTGDGRASLTKNFGGFKYGVRIDYLPFGTFTSGGEFFMDDLEREYTPKLVIGAVYSFNNGATSAMGNNGGRYIYGDADQHILLPNYSKWVFDYLFKFRGFYSLGSYVITNASVPNGIAGEFKLNGTFTKYNSSETPESINSTVRSRLNLGKGLNVQAGYVFPFNTAIGVQYTSLNNDLQSADFASYDKFYNAIITQYLKQHNLKVQLQFGYSQLQKSLQTVSNKGTYTIQFMSTIQI